MMENASTLVTRRPDRSLTVTDRMARTLGWFGIGLGLAELIAPGRIGRAVGLEGKETLIRSYGVREIASGVGALSTDPRPAMWSRVGGDLLDLGTLAAGLRAADGRQRRNASMAIAAVVGATAIDLLTAVSLMRQRSRSRGERRDYSHRSGFPGGAQARESAGRGSSAPRDRKAPPLEDSMSPATQTV